jgi:hypothetical protein
LNAALDDLQAVMFKWKENLSMIKPTLHRRANGPNYWYRLQLVEEADDNRNWYNQKFEDCVKWTDNKLKDWPNCNRMAHDMWDFKNRKDAEKFITLFHLSWEQ